MPKRNLIWALAILAAAGVLVLVTRPGPRHVVTGGGAVDPLSRALRIIESEYLYEVDPALLRRSSLQAIATHLDPHSAYLPPGTARTVDDRIGGKAFGIGLHVEVEDGNAVVVGALPHSPALRSPLRAGDCLLAVGEAKTGGLSEEQVRSLLRTAPCSEEPGPVSLRVARGSGEPFLVEIVPDAYPVESVQGLYRDGRHHWVYALAGRPVPATAPAAAPAPPAPTYIRVREFLPDTLDALRSVLRCEPLRDGLVLDLRDNPGGYLEIAVGVADLFLREGVIVTVRHRGGQQEVYEAQASRKFPPAVPIVVLVNDQTASGAELVAAALQYHGRGVVVGTRTVGKGCVQALFPLGRDLGELSLTTAEFRVDPNRPIARLPGAAEWGVEPDVPAALSPEPAERLRRLRRHTEVLARRAPHTRPASDGTDEDPSSPLASLLESDRPLREALELLRDRERYESLLAAARRERESRESQTRPAEE